MLDDLTRRSAALGFHVAVGLPTRLSTFRIVVRKGWNSATDLPLFWAPNWPRSRWAHQADASRRVADRDDADPTRVRDREIEWARTLPLDLAGVVDSEFGDDRVAFLRTVDWLRWRYEQRPAHAYRCVTVRGPEGLEGLAVTTIVRRMHVPMGLIVELLTTPAPRTTTIRCLISESRRRLADEGAIVTCLLARQPSALHASSRAGLWLARGAVELRKQMVVWTWLGASSETTRGSWALAFGDSDAV